MGMVLANNGKVHGEVINGNDRDTYAIIKITQRQQTWVDRVITGMKALASIAFTSRSWWVGGERNSLSRDGTFDYRDRVPNGGRNNAIVMSCIGLIATSFAQSPPQVMKKKDDSDEIVPNHLMTKLLMKPNPYYSGKLMWNAIMADYAFGNAYLIKVRSRALEPVRLYWIPAQLIKPKWPDNDPTVFISHYEYKPNGIPIEIPVEDVVHFRNGIDPENLRMGLSPLGALLREIATDEEAAEYTNTILRNLGVAGMVISPLNDKVTLSSKDAAAVKASIMTRTSGDKRGEPLVLGGAAKVDMLGADPAKLDMAGIRHVSEERITAIFGTPAIVVGLGAGLEHATYDNVEGMRKIFYENKLIPTQETIAADLDAQLLVDFEDNVEEFATEFDNRKVRVLQEDEDAKVARIDKELRNGTLTMNEARQLRDRQAMDEDAYMLDSRIVPTPIAELLAKPAPTVIDATTGKPVPIDPATGKPALTDGGNTDPNAPAAGGGKALATKDLGNSMTRVRARMEAQARRDVHAYLTEQKLFVLAQVDAGEKAAAAFRVNWPRLQEDVDKLKSVLEPWYKRVLVAVHDVVQDALDARYEMAGSDERTYLKLAGTNIKHINEVTRMAVADAVKASVEQDETTDELRARLETLDVFSESRAELIAKTELAAATNLAQLESYKASDVVVGILITDGDSDKVCAAIDGTKVPIAEMRSIPPIAHPHCVRRFHHITDPSELKSEEAA